jgi:hypothetical protein
MKDYLKDLIDHTHGLGVDLIKVTGTDTTTVVDTITEDRTVIIKGNFKNPISDFIGVFGMPNISKLKTIVGFDEYDDKSNIFVTHTQRDGVDIPGAIHFETSSGDFINDYRLMLKSVVEEKVTIASFKGATWNVEFEPSVAGIMRLKKQSQANSDEKQFSAKVIDGDLRFYFGDPSTHSGNFVFHTQVEGVLNKDWKWPVKEFMSIMDLVGDKMVRIADAGAMEIIVDSGLATYRYLIPAQTK